MPSNKPRILIVDDGLSLCDILVNLLSYEGYDTVIAHESKSALQILKKETFDLMLLDLKLPDTNGVELLEKAIKLVPGIQVVMISGQGTIDIAVDATSLLSPPPPIGFNNLESNELFLFSVFFFC